MLTPGQPVIYNTSYGYIINGNNIDVIYRIKTEEHTEVLRFFHVFYEQKCSDADCSKGARAPPPPKPCIWDSCLPYLPLLSLQLLLRGSLPLGYPIFGEQEITIDRPFIFRDLFFSNTELQIP